MDDCNIAALCAAFAARWLPKHRWTHEAHLVVCTEAVARLGPDAALAHLRQAIRAYNEATGTPNTDSGGYHETLTAYYVGAVHEAVVRAALRGATPSVDELVRDASCSRTAPLVHWTPDRLFSTEARRTWVAPDLVPISGWRPRPQDRPGGR